MIDRTKVVEARRRGCQACLFWAGKPKQAWEGEAKGECRVAPPRTSNGVRFPVMYPSDWCASFEALDDEPAGGHDVQDRIPGSAPVIS